MKISRSMQVRLLCRLAAVAMLLLHQPAQPAGFPPINVAASPGSQPLAIGAPVPMVVTWVVTANGNPANDPVTLSSIFGQFRAGGPGGPVLGTVPRVLSTTVLGAGPSVFNRAFTEGVAVPESMVLQSLQLGFNTIIYERTFSTTIATSCFICNQTAWVVFNLTGSGGAGFNISQISLRFPDDSRVTIHPRTEPLYALADLTFSGSGFLEAVWEIAEPTTTAGDPIFRPLKLEHRQLIGALQQITLQSPKLPTQNTGLYLVRLKVDKPQLAYASPVIRYFVNPGLSPTIEPERLTQVSPLSGALANARTLFRWRGVQGTAAYQLEFHDHEFGTSETRELGSTNERDKAAEPSLRPEAEPRMGMTVTAESTQAILSRAALSHLLPGKTYWWTVLAFDKQGRVIGQSELRPIVFTSTITNSEEPQSRFRPKGTTGQGANGLPVQLPDLGE